MSGPAFGSHSQLSCLAADEVPMFDALDAIVDRMAHRRVRIGMRGRYPRCISHATLLAGIAPSPTVFATHLLARRRDRAYLLSRELDGLDGVRGRRDAAPTHDLDEVRTALELLPRRLQDLRHAVGRAAEGLGVPRAAARAAGGRPEVCVATCMGTVSCGLWSVWTLDVPVCESALPHWIRRGPEMRPSAIALARALLAPPSRWGEFTKEFMIHSANPCHERW